MDATESLLLVIDNDRPLYDWMMDLAGGQQDRLELADAMKERLEWLMDDINLKPVGTISPSFRESADLIARQMIQHAMQQVDWLEIADHYLGKVQEQAAV